MKKYDMFDEMTRRESVEKDSIENILEPDEQVLWRAKPKKSAFVANKILTMMPFALIWLAFDGFFLTMVFTQGDFPSQFLWFLIPFFALHLLPVWIWIANVVTAGKRYRNAEYVATDKRIIVRGGFIGVNFVSTLYKDINHVEVRVGAIDKLLKVGDIYIYSNVMVSMQNNRPKTDGMILDVEDPYDVYAQLQKIITDVQTDISYPNAMRPDVNKGYKTRYQPDDGDDENSNEKR